MFISPRHMTELATKCLLFSTTMINCIRKSISFELFSTNQEIFHINQLTKRKFCSNNARRHRKRLLHKQLLKFKLSLPNESALIWRHHPQIQVKLWFDLWFTLFLHLTKNIFRNVLKRQSIKQNAKKSSFKEKKTKKANQKALTFMLRMTSTTQPFIKYQTITILCQC